MIHIAFTLLLSFSTGQYLPLNLRPTVLLFVFKSSEVNCVVDSFVFGKGFRSQKNPPFVKYLLDTLTHQR